MNESTLPTESTATTHQAETVSTTASPQHLAEPVQPLSEERHAYQTWYMLNSLAISPDRWLKWGDIKRKVLSKKAREQLGLTEASAEQVLDELKQGGQVNTREKRGTVIFELTEKGAQSLRSLTAHPAFAASAAAGSPVTEETLRFQHACLLLHLLEAENQCLTKSDANARLGRFVQRDIGLNPAVANVRRVQLARFGYIEIDKSGRQETYRLTNDGRDYLAALEQFPATEFRLRGATINALLTAARESPAARDEPPQVPAMEESPALAEQEVS